MYTGLFFGSFNPVHVGHMVIANYMLEHSDMKELWFVVSPHNPLKKKESLLPDYHRLALVELAIGDNYKMKASNIEFKLPQPSYTCDTMAYLTEKYPDKKFGLIMGSDNLNNFRKWKNHEVLLENYKLFVYPRPETDNEGLLNHRNVELVNAPLMNISSTYIRKSIKKGLDVRYFMPKAVSDYVKEMHFYEK